jgi:hypothetical protein
MLPKIPYAMHKNKKLSIPFGNFNRSSSFSDGDIYESHNISARKYPYLTTKKANRKLSEYDGRDVEAITVFDGKLVTSQEDGVYIDQKKVFDVEDAHGTRFAPINTKLVVYPDKKYIEKVGDGEYSSANLEATYDVSKAAFTANSVTGGMIETDRPYFNLLFHANTNSLYDMKLNIPTGINTFYIGNGTLMQTKRAYQNLSNGDKHYIFGCYQDGEKIGIYTSGIDSQFSWDEKRVVIYDYDKKKVVAVGKYTSSSGGENPVVFIKSTSTISDGDYSVFIEEKSNPYCNYKSYVSEGQMVLIWTYDSAIAYGKAISVSKGELKLDCTLTGAFKFDGATLLNSQGGGGLCDLLYINSEIIVNDSASNTGTYTVASVSVGKVTFAADCTVTDEFIPSSKVKISGGSADLFPQFKVGDCVTISGCSIEENNISFVISKKTNSTLFASTDIFTAKESETITISRTVPDLDFICEKDNRLYGVSNKDKTIYVSALGDPTNMFAYEGVSTDSFAVAVGGEGDFTACCKYGDSVLFFKEDKLYKLTGSYPAEFALYSYDVEGVARDSEKSCVVVNEVLYYHGDKGIYAYSGGIPTLISSNFGEFRGNGAVGGTDGENYYVALWNLDADDDTYLFSYNTRLNLWTLEQRHPFYVDAARVQGKPMFLTKDGEIDELNLDEDVHDQKWSVQFTPFYETIEGKKSYSRIVMRVSIPKDSFMQIRLRFDGGYWLNAGTIVGKGDSVIPVRIPINRCDKFELELSGKGECTILDIMREYYVSEE